ncbi:MAG: hypothetical protein KGN79_13255 [Acidobacteriota bacterium]|nr:hypothetical protein [Acidobacteriota bacterium]
MIGSQEMLRKGARIIEPVLQPWGFEFRHFGAGASSGGQFASGEFFRLNRSLELHFRNSLGLVTYSAGQFNTSHETYMRELGVWNDCHYPGFSSDPLQAFAGLAHDLQFAEDFLHGSAEVLERAAVNEAASNAQKTEADMASYVGDTAQLTTLHDAFYARDYNQVLAIAAILKYPDRLSRAQQTMIQIARDRSNPVQEHSFFKLSKDQGRK